MAELYKEQYCEKHNQHYGYHLHQCPICVGEEMVKKDEYPNNLTTKQYEQAMIGA